MGAAVPHQAPQIKGPRRFFTALVGSGLFTGYFPIAPATVTSFFTLVPVYLLTRHRLWLGQALAIVGLFFWGVVIATDLERVWGKDPKRVTIDEIVGTLITFFLVPYSVKVLVLGFFVWRFFDIVKLPFIRKSQALPGGWGVMIDDVLAGICANLLLQVAIRLLPALRQ